MPWTLVSNRIITPGTEQNVANVLLVQQSFAFRFPNFSLGDRRQFGFAVYKLALGLPDGTVDAEQEFHEVWHNPTRILLSNAGASGAVWFGVPKKFGTSLSVNTYRFSP